MKRGPSLHDESLLNNSSESDRTEKIARINECADWLEAGASLAVSHRSHEQGKFSAQMLRDYAAILASVPDQTDDEPQTIRCPFCNRDPFHRSDSGEAVAITCCDLGNLLFRGARPEPETVEISWDDFCKIAEKLDAVKCCPVPDQGEAVAWRTDFENAWDGREVLISNGKTVYAAYWGLDDKSFGAGATKKYPWTILDSTNGVNHVSDGWPTKWMPLPNLYAAPHVQTPSDMPPTPTEREELLTGDIRWAVNALLESIAVKFEAWDTWDLFRSDAASTVRSFKHDLANVQTPAQVSGKWPSGCQDANSCARHRACMYLNCKHDDQDVIDAVDPTPPQGDSGTKSGSEG